MTETCFCRFDSAVALAEKAKLIDRVNLEVELILVAIVERDRIDESCYWYGM